MSRRASGARTRHQIPWHGMDHGKMMGKIRTGTYWESKTQRKLRKSGRYEVISMFCYVLFIFSNYTALCFLIRSAERGISYMFGHWIWSNDFNRRFDAEQPSNEFRRCLERENLWPPPGSYCAITKQSGKPVVLHGFPVDFPYCFYRL